MSFLDLRALLHRIPEHLIKDTVNDVVTGRSWREGQQWLLENAEPEAREYPFDRRYPRDYPISDDAFDLIVFCEVTSEEVYNANYRTPIWPGEHSGVTIGIGYDVGYVNRAKLWTDWAGIIPDEMIEALEVAVGVTGPPAKPIARALRNRVNVPFAAAISVHSLKVLPRWFEIVESHLDNTDLLTSDSFGALVSLTYNRGASFSESGARYTEMRAIKAHMRNQRFDRIPAEIRSMKRLWPNSAGLRKRRELEAALFEKGLEQSIIQLEDTHGRNAPSTIMLAVDSTSLNLRSVPSSAQGMATVIEVLPRGQLLTMHSYAPVEKDWVKVTSAAGRIGYVKRMLTVQANPGTLVDIPPDILHAFNVSVFQDSIQFNNVTYELGAKNPTRGTVDCSGWIHFINKRAFSEVNREARAEIFTSGAAGLLNTHSDHQVAIPGYHERQLFSKGHIRDLEFRPGLLIGLNFGDHGWERGQHRVFEIDHIVQTVADPDGILWITQSSSSGRGVNMVKFDEWIGAGSVSRLINANRMHIFDVFQMAKAEVLRSVFGERDLVGDERDLEIPEQDTSETPAS